MSNIFEDRETVEQRKRVGRQVKMMIAYRDLRQNDLAGALGIGQSELSKRINGSVSFKIEELFQLSDFFDVPVGMLFGEVPFNPGSPAPIDWSGRRDSNPQHSAWNVEGSELLLLEVA